MIRNRPMNMSYSKKLNTYYLKIILCSAQILIWLTKHKGRGFEPQGSPLDSLRCQDYIFSPSSHVEFFFANRLGPDRSSHTYAHVLVGGLWSWEDLMTWPSLLNLITTLITTLTLTLNLTLRRESNPEASYYPNPYHNLNQDVTLQTVQIESQPRIVDGASEFYSFLSVADFF